MPSFAMPSGTIPPQLLRERLCDILLSFTQAPYPSSSSPPPLLCADPALATMGL